MTFIATVGKIAARNLQLHDARADEVAEDIVGLAEAVFGPFDPEVEAVWREAGRLELGHVDVASLLVEADREKDPLSFLDTFPSERSRLEGWIRVRWSSKRARRDGRPSTLNGLTWADLDEGAQADVRDGLRHLLQYERGHVGRGVRPKTQLGTFLLELADIFAREVGFQRHATELSSHIDGKFISLAASILDALPPSLPDDEGKTRPRVHVLSRSPQALSNRWRKLRKARKEGTADATSDTT